ncbi:MAG: DUF3842 family protein [Clostridiaceae bacterium]|jgi:NAD(P)-dependent dehydrogenase (short-subunit alcohol dehydrogenase family)|nr:DUF3842 family protein [Clostridiaceae bacterium]
MRIAVVDGQGGGMGKVLVERIRATLGSQVEIIALGTNALATAAMLKAGADEGASGENAITVNASRVDYILGSVGIISANSMLGEMTPKMAVAIAESPARKILIPFNRCGLIIAGARDEPPVKYIEEAAELLKTMIAAK